MGRRRRRSGSTASRSARSAIGERRRRGLGAVPEERNGHGAVPGFSLADNAVLTARDRKGMVRHGVIVPAAARGYAEEVIRAFAVKATGPGGAAGSLSGGNLQKFIMGREVLQVPEVLIVSQPTWGVDAGAAAAIHQALVDLARARLGDRGDQPGPRRAAGALATRSRSSTRGGCRRSGDRRHLDRGDRPADGRGARRGGQARTCRARTSARRRAMLFELEKRKEPSRAMV